MSTGQQKLCHLGDVSLYSMLQVVHSLQHHTNTVHSEQLAEVLFILHIDRCILDANALHWAQP